MRSPDLLTTGPGDSPAVSLPTPFPSPYDQEFLRGRAGQNEIGPSSFYTSVSTPKGLLGLERSTDFLISYSNSRHHLFPAGFGRGFSRYGGWRVRRPTYLSVVCGDSFVPYLSLPLEVETPCYLTSAGVVPRSVYPCDPSYVGLPLRLCVGVSFLFYNLDLLFLQTSVSSSGYLTVVPLGPLAETVWFSTVTVMHYFPVLYTGVRSLPTPRH